MIKKIATVALWVDDFDAAVYFYQVILGLELFSHHGDVPQFKVGDGILVLVKGRLPTAQNAFPPEFPPVTFEVDDLDEMVRRLMSENVEMASSIEERRDSRWIKVCDPADNMIELIEIKEKESR